LTEESSNDTFVSVQLTIDIPDELAKRLEPQRADLVEILRRGLRVRDAEPLTAVEEVFDFFASRPDAEEIIAYRPCEKSVERLRQLLEKNRDGSLTSDEETELETLEALNDFFAIVKARARQQLNK
jgi:Holliday junction resolvase